MVKVLEPPLPEPRRVVLGRDTAGSTNVYMSTCDSAHDITDSSIIMPLPRRGAGVLRDSRYSPRVVYVINKTLV